MQYHHQAQETLLAQQMELENRLTASEQAQPKPQPPAASAFFFNDTATTEIYTLSLHDALPISQAQAAQQAQAQAETNLAQAQATFQKEIQQAQEMVNK